MGFYPVYYFTIACPTIDKTMEMVDKYMSWFDLRGIQLDMPSNNPYAETDMVKAMMKGALETYQGYDIYMDAIRKIREKYPAVELHIVVYPDVIASVGVEKFAAFCREIQSFTVRIAGNEVCEKEVAYLNSQGIVTSDYINYSMPETDFVRCKNTKGIIHLRSKRVNEPINEGLSTWKQRLEYVKRKGITARIFAVAELKTAADLKEVREAGADGAYVGNVLMNLWKDEKALRQLLGEMEATSVK